MKRKLISFTIILALLMQSTVFAGILTTNILTQNSGAPQTYTPIPVDTGVYVSPAGSSTYDTSTTEPNFDLKASIDMTTVRTYLGLYYAAGKSVADDYGGTTPASYENSNVTGEFTITFTNTTGITQAAGAAKPFTKAQLDSQLAAKGVIFTIDSITTTSSGTTVTNTIKAKVKSGITAKALKDNSDTYLANFDLDLDQLTATSKKSAITVYMTGYVEITETDETSPFTRLDFNSVSVTTAYGYNVSTGGSTGGGKIIKDNNTGNTGTQGSVVDSFTVNEDGSVSVPTSGKSVTDKSTKDGTTTATTTVTGTSSDKNDDGSKTDTETTTKIVTEKDARTGEVGKSTVTETKTVTTTDADGNETKSVITSEIEKTTDPKEGTTNISTSQTTETSGTVSEGGVSVGTTTSQTTGTRKVTVKETPEKKEGFIENGWSDTPYSPGDPEYKGTSDIDAKVIEKTTTTTTVVVDENGDPVLDENGNVQYVTTVTTTADVVLYPKYVNITVPEALRPATDKNGNYLHNAYVVGYPDGEIKPNKNVSREEVAAIFYRLLNEKVRAGIEATEHSFPDVESERWSNNSVATMAKGVYIVGDENGNFNPSNPITRAEFTVIASKFAPASAESAENYFTDIDGHWAKDYILKATGQYWISGYEDGSFKPDAYITRAEAMTIINRMLVRYGDIESLYAKNWPDVMKSDWFYGSVIEATTDNGYERKSNGWSETWVE